jgi:hypothetical protein
LSAYQFALPLLILAVAVAIRIVYGHLSGWLALRQHARSEASANERLMASLRLRLPANAEFVTLEHEMFFYDPRNRDAARGVFAENGFTVTTAETYDGRAKYWLLASRTCLVDKVLGELGRVYEFSKHYGGRYNSCNPKL